ncbi:MAG: S41 family peptidase [Verrucomicrobiota bacterium]
MRIDVRDEFLPRCNFVKPLLCFVALIFVVLTFCSASESETIEGGGVVDENDIAYRKMKQLAEVMIHIREHHVDEAGYDEIVAGALDGMLKSMDKYSGFLKKEAFDEIRMETSGQYSGIGIHVGIRNGFLTVIAPIEDTPGFRAGLQSGDQILEIDGKEMTDPSLEEAVKMMRGGKGEPVSLKIRSQDEKEPRDVTIIRDDIEVPSVKGQRVIRDNIGYVRITNFAETTADHLESVLENLKTNNMEALIIDLRSNPGGLLTAAQQVAQKFLKRGSLIVTTKGRPGVHEPKQLIAGGSYEFLDLPIAVLINGGTASASEIVAGALHSHNKAILVGDTSFGKGSVQSVVPLRSEENTAIRLTTAYYYTPDGRRIHENGLEPDVRVYVSAGQWRRIQLNRAKVETRETYVEDGDISGDVTDLQLERAADILQAVMVFRTKGG